MMGACALPQLSPLIEIVFLMVDWLIIYIVILLLSFEMAFVVLIILFPALNAPIAFIAWSLLLIGEVVVEK